jgi:phage terminase small subunit
LPAAALENATTRHGSVRHFKRKELPMPKTKPAQAAPEWAAGLSHRERVFCEHYVVTLNGTRAALAAGYGRGTNANVGSRQAALLLAKPRVATAINALVQERSGASQSLVLQKLGAIATTDITDVAEVKDGQLIVKDTSELSPEALVAVAGYDLNERGYLNVRLHDRIRALDMLSKVLGMKRSVNAEQPNVSVNVQVNAAEASTNVLTRIDDLIKRREALPPPAEQPMQVISAPTKEIIHVKP